MVKEALVSRDAARALSWAGLSLVVYGVTVAPGLVWADSAKLTLYALAGYLPSLNPGDHPGWVLLAGPWVRLWPDPVLAAHWMSAVSASVAVGLASLVVRLRGGSEEQASTVAVVLLASHPLWWSATVAESYAPALALTLAGAVVSGASRSALAAWLGGALWGLALATHGAVVFLVAPLAWGHRRVATAIGAAFGLAPLWLAVVGGPIDPLTGFQASGIATWRWHLEAFLAVGRAGGNVVVLLALVALALGPLGVAAGIRTHGWLTPVRPLAWGVVGLAGFLLFYARFRLHLMVLFMLVALLLLRPVALSRTLRLAHLGVQASLYVALPALAVASGHGDLGLRVLPFRSNAYYFLCPMRSLPVHRLAGVVDPGAERYVAAVASCAPAGAAVLSDFNPGAVLALAQRARGWRRDLDLHPVAVDVALGAPDPGSAIAANVADLLARRRVVLADVWEPYYHLAGLGPAFEIVRCAAGAVVRRRGAGGG